MRRCTRRASAFRLLPDSQLLHTSAISLAVICVCAITFPPSRHSLLAHELWQTLRVKPLLAVFVEIPDIGQRPPVGYLLIGPVSVQALLYNPAHATICPRLIALLTLSC